MCSCLLVRSELDAVLMDCVAVRGCKDIGVMGSWSCWGRGWTPIAETAHVPRECNKKRGSFIECRAGFDNGPTASNSTDRQRNTMARVFASSGAR